jgi:hypothetical protein
MLFAWLRPCGGHGSATLKLPDRETGGSDRWRKAMMRTTLFPHAAAWSVLAVLLAGIAAPQMCGAHSTNVQVQSDATYPVVEVVPEDRPDRHDYDAYAFTEEMNHQQASPPVRTARRPGVGMSLPGGTTNIGF